MNKVKTKFNFKVTMNQNSVDNIIKMDKQK